VVEPPALGTIAYAFVGKPPANQRGPPSSYPVLPLAPRFISPVSRSRWCALPPSFYELSAGGHCLRTRTQQAVREGSPMLRVPYPKEVPLTPARTLEGADMRIQSSRSPALVQRTVLSDIIR